MSRRAGKTQTATGELAVPLGSVKALLGWFTAHARTLPWRRQRDPYGVWVSEIMLQQTQVRTVIPYWERWMQQLPTLASLARAEESHVLKLWEGLGYYSRARNLQRAARQLIAAGRTGLPGTLDALLELPGIGRYTAGAIASIAFGQPAPILDGNVIRVLSRVYALSGDPKKAENNARLWTLAEAWVGTAAPRCGDLNEALMELGATCCTPQEPGCTRCPLASSCRASQAGDPTRFPEIPARPKTERRRFATLVLRHQDQVWVRQRPPGSVNAGLWEFPNTELETVNADPCETIAKVFGLPTRQLSPGDAFQHSVTRYRITQCVVLGNWRGRAGTGVRLGDGRWIAIHDLQTLAMTGPHRKWVRVHLEPQPTRPETER